MGRGWELAVADGKFYSSWIYDAGEIALHLFRNKAREVLIENGVEPDLLEEQYAAEWDMMIEDPTGAVSSYFPLPNVRDLKEAQAAAIAIWRTL